MLQPVAATAARKEGKKPPAQQVKKVARLDPTRTVPSSHLISLILPDSSRAGCFPTEISPIYFVRDFCARSQAHQLLDLSREHRRGTPRAPEQPLPSNLKGVRPLHPPCHCPARVTDLPLVQSPHGSLLSAVRALPERPRAVFALGVGCAAVAASWAVAVDTFWLAGKVRGRRQGSIPCPIHLTPATC